MGFFWSTLLGLNENLTGNNWNPPPIGDAGLILRLEFNPGFLRRINAAAGAS
jgi:hypothetical protein